MIGLGSNRLTVCRRGGMSVMQAGRGGMEWLAGGRAPLWSSPYSDQATAALLAQFPTQWPTIRDYGIAHPEIVGYMNAYAPEDAKIAYSLVEGIGTRWLDAPVSAYINLHYIHKTTTNVDITYKITSTGGWGSLFGSRKGDFRNNAYILRFYSSTAYMCYNRTGAETYNSIATKLNTKYRCVIQGLVAKFYEGEDATLVNTINCTGTNNAGVSEWLLFANNQSTTSTGVSVENTGLHSIAKFKVLEGTTAVREMYPFIRKINGVDTCGMIDVLSGTFYQNAGSGSFTISETPAS